MCLFSLRWLPEQSEPDFFTPVFFCPNFFSGKVVELTRWFQRFNHHRLTSGVARGGGSCNYIIVPRVAPCHLKSAGAPDKCTPKHEVVSFGECQKAAWGRHWVTSTPNFTGAPDETTQKHIQVYVAARRQCRILHLAERSLIIGHWLLRSRSS